MLKFQHTYRAKYTTIKTQKQEKCDRLFGKEDFMKIAFFDTKPYDKPSFEEFGGKEGISFKYFETKKRAPDKTRFLSSYDVENIMEINNF